MCVVVVVVALCLAAAAYWDRRRGLAVGTDPERLDPTLDAEPSRAAGALDTDQSSPHPSAGASDGHEIHHYTDHDQNDSQRGQ